MHDRQHVTGFRHGSQLFVGSLFGTPREEKVFGELECLDLSLLTPPPLISVAISLWQILALVTEHVSVINIYCCSVEYVINATTLPIDYFKSSLLTQPDRSQCCFVSNPYSSTMAFSIQVRE